MADSLQQKVIRVLSFAYRGEHHIPGKIREPSGKLYYEVNVPHGLSTCDFDILTRLVIGCHQVCVRMEICASGPGLLKLRFHDRTARGGLIWDCHPTMETAVKQLWPDRLAKLVNQGGEEVPSCSAQNAEASTC